MSSKINATTTSGLATSADNTGVLELQINGVTQLTLDSTGVYGNVERGTVQNSTSGTTIDFTGIPAWAKRITVMLNGVSTSGANHPLIQLGTSGGVETTGYSGCGAQSFSTGASSYTNGFGFPSAGAGNVLSGAVTFFNVSGNIWVCSGNIGGGTNLFTLGGAKTLGSTLDRIRVTTTTGTDTFDAGSINILYEG